MVGALSPLEIDEFLDNQLFARLGCHFEGKTYVVPISFARHEDKLFGQTSLGLKIEMMRGNPEVCVELDEVHDLTNWRSVIVTGRYEELSGLDAARAAGLMIDKYGPIFEELSSAARRGRNVTPPPLGAERIPQVAYCIHILEKSGRYETTT